MAHPAVTRTQAEDLLFHEARLLDDRRLEEWLTLYTDDALYWVPIDESTPVAANASLIYDNAMRRQERVDHYLHNVFPSQSPCSRTIHAISNVIVEADGANAKVRSTQVIYEMRTGDFTQVGLGEVQSLPAIVEHQLRQVDGVLKIAQKKILLIHRDTWQGNLMFML
ncbi:MAG: aromatic-ring-hydroxylating dioxygenase subunit beta [Burkholderiales bacterium]